MHADDNNKNQAEELRELFQEAERNSPDQTNESEHTYQVDLREIDVLNLPPRKEVHTGSKRTKLKISRPFIRLLLISLLVIIVLVAAFFLFDGELGPVQTI